MSQETPWAEHAQMDRRAALANEFFAATGAELIPFVSDEATWYDFDYLETAELAAAIASHYGVALDETALASPFWGLLDFLDANRTCARGNDPEGIVMSDGKSNREGYLAMVEFLRGYLGRAKSGSLAALVADVEVAGDGEPFDPAMWSDWLAALKVVRDADAGSLD